MPKNSPKPRRVETTKYKSEQNKEGAGEQLYMSQERLLETHIDIEGVAPSDLQVAAHIQHLSDSSLLDNVELVESKEHKSEDTLFRQFKLKAMLKDGVHLTSDDIKKIIQSVSSV